MCMEDIIQSSTYKGGSINYLKQNKLPEPLIPNLVIIYKSRSWLGRCNLQELLKALDNGPIRVAKGDVFLLVPIRSSR